MLLPNQRVFGRMKSLFFLALTVALFSGAIQKLAAGPTNSLAGVTTSFVEDGVLTADEVAAVVNLAELGGVSQVAKVTTLHYRPSRVRGIRVIGAEKVDGRKVIFQTLEVYREGWSYKAKPADPIRSKSIGQFWIESPSPPPVDILTRFETSKGEVRIYLDPGIPLPVADKIINAVASGKIRYDGEVRKEETGKVDFSQPDCLVRSDAGCYLIIFAGSPDQYKFNLKGDEVTLRSLTHVYP